MTEYEEVIQIIKDKHYGYYSKNIPLAFEALHKERPEWTNEQLRRKIYEDLIDEVTERTIIKCTPGRFKKTYTTDEKVEKTSTSEHLHQAKLEDKSLNESTEKKSGREITHRGGMATIQKEKNKEDHKHKCKYCGYEFP